MSINIREYNPEDKSEVVELIQLNSPNYFHPSEIDDFKEYLEKEIEDYFVIESDENIVACAGINYFPGRETARLSWDAVHPENHGQGLGRIINEYRINHIRNLKKYSTIEVRTSQFAHGFYAKFGFELLEIKKDFWATGFDLYLMKINI